MPGYILTFVFFPQRVPAPLVRIWLSGLSALPLEKRLLLLLAGESFLFFINVMLIVEEPYDYFPAFLLLWAFFFVLRTYKHVVVEHQIFYGIAVP